MLAGIYEPRATAGTVLHQVVRTHLDRFLAETAAATDGAGVPRFIEREFRHFLGCAVCGAGQGTCNVVNPNGGFTPPAVTTVWDWINQVNAANFAGRADWRLPAEAGQITGSCVTDPCELETILLLLDPCPTPCIDPIFGPTASNFYWSATPHVDTALVVNFGPPNNVFFPKDSALFVRAVRGGP